MDRIEAPLKKIQPIGRDASVITFSIPPQGCAPKPGQFYMVKLLAGGFPLFGRALAVLDRTEEGELSFLVKEAGKGTAMMRAMQPGDRALLIGPAGNWFPSLEKARRVLFVAGGTGVAAFYYFMKHQAPPYEPVLLYGAQNEESLYLHEALERMPLTLEVSTDDGSRGFKGFVSELMRIRLDEPDVVYCCGPDPMMKAVAGICAKEGITVYLSLETRMACGIGVCNGCAVEVVRNGKRRFERVCHEGPVFQAGLLPSFIEP